METEITIILLLFIIHIKLLWKRYYHSFKKYIKFYIDLNYIQISIFLNNVLQ